MKFTYVGDEQGTTAFGLSFPRGVAVEVSDAHAIRKLTNNAFFAQVFDGVEVMQPAPVVAEQPKRRGRPPKAK